MKILKVRVNGVKSLPIFTKSNNLDLLGYPKHISVHIKYDPKTTFASLYSDTYSSNT